MENNNKANQPLSSVNNPSNATAPKASTQPTSTPQAQINKPAATPVAEQQPLDALKSFGATASESVTETINSLRDTVEERYTQGKADVQSWISETDWNKTVGQLPQSIKDLGSKAADQFNKLTTTQKVVGGALLLGGLGYLASRKTQKSSADTWSEIKARSKDYRSGNIPKVDASSRATEWNPSTSSSARVQDNRSKSQSPSGQVNMDS